MAGLQAAPPRVANATGDYVLMQLSQLRSGATLRSPILDGKEGASKLLLAGGTTLTDRQLGALQRRGINAVLVHRSDADHVSRTPSAPGALSSRQRDFLRRSTAAAAPAGVRLATGWRLESDSFLHQLTRPAEPTRSAARSAAYEKNYLQTVATTTALFDEFVHTGRVNPHQVCSVAQQHLHQIAEDLDEFVERGVRPVEADYPSRHSVQTAMLATSMGALMGLRRDELTELSFGCLLHDAGMLLVPQHLHRHVGDLSAGERLELQKHPIHAADLLNRTPGVSHAAKMVVYQMHERMNGTGYPRQRQGSQIHLLARIAAVADTYLALVSPRPFRPGLEPYQAVEKLLYAARKGLFDGAAVRALLHAVSLFPIGSTVRLSDDRVALVTRANRDQFARPVVEILSATATPTGEIVDLSQFPELSVVSTASLQRAEVGSRAD